MTMNNGYFVPANKLAAVGYVARAVEQMQAEAALAGHDNTAKADDRDVSAEAKFVPARYLEAVGYIARAVEQAETGNAATDKESKFGENINFYSDWIKTPQYRTALNAQYVCSRQGNPTLNIEIAPIEKAGASPSWGNKITLQLSKTELTDFCAVLLRLLHYCEGKYHGKTVDKGFMLHDNLERGLNLTLIQSKTSYSHILNRPERTELAAFAVHQLAKAWKVEVHEALTLLSSTYGVQGGGQA